MCKLDELPPIVTVNGIEYDLQVYTTAWGRRCVSYRNIMDHKGYLCSVTVEPENEPVEIEAAKGLNKLIGNAKTFEDATDMIHKFIVNLIFYNK